MGQLLKTEKSQKHHVIREGQEGSKEGQECPRRVRELQGE